MRNDSIETLLLRHCGSVAPTPAGLEPRLSAMVRQEVAAAKTRQQAIDTWNQRRVSRRRLLQLATLSGAGLSALAVGLNTFQSRRPPAYSL